MRGIARHLLLALAIAIGTWVFGWWMVPLLGAAWGVMERGRPLRAATAGLAAALAWALLLAVDAARGPLDRVAAMLGGILGAPGLVVMLVTLLFAALLAACAAQVAGAFAPSKTIPGRSQHP